MKESYMMKFILTMAVILGFYGARTWAQEATDSSSPVTQKRAYPGGADEESLSVLTRLPEAPLRTSARQIQKEVYKTIYNQELKDESTETMEE